MTIIANRLPYFYEKELKRVMCYSYVDFIETLAIIQTKGKEIDVNKSLFAASYSLIYVDGKYKEYYAWYEMFNNMEEDLGIKLDLSKSSASMSTYTMYLKEALDFKTEDSSMPSIIEVVEESLKDLSEDTEEDKPELEKLLTEPGVFDKESSDDDNINVVTDVVEDDKESSSLSVEVDYEYLESLYNEDDVAESKKELENTVKELYGIDLRRNLSFENMIKSLKQEMK